MGHNDLILFSLQICLMLAFALFFGKLMHKLHQPIVLGELIGGIILGPTVIGTLAPGTFEWLFPPSGATIVARDAVLKLGMLFFMFAAGLEVNLAHVRQRGLSIVLTSVLGIAVPFALGFLSVLFFPDLWGISGKIGRLMLALLVGTALSISALAVIVRILNDLNLLQKELGVVIVSSATVNNLIGWSLFSVVLSAIVPDGLPGTSLMISIALVIGFSALILTLGRWAGQRLLNWLQPHLTWSGSFLGAMIVLMLCVATIAEAVGMHAIFGAFLAGVALASHYGEQKQVHEVVYRFAISFFAPIYFVSIGLKANFAVNFDLPLVLFILLIACVGKICGAGLGAWIGGMSKKDALAVGFGMNARGMMEMILASIALEYNLIDQRIFVALIMMALITSMISGPVLQKLVTKET
jgi:Kef-type K+ transport system membrane component KefB